MANGKKKTDDRILTLHPAGKQGVRIERAKYDQMRRALLRVIPSTKAGVPFKGLPDLVVGHLDRAVFPPGTGIGYYVTTVKQDLEARGEIEIVEGSRPQRLRRIRGGGR